jgi:hypothetical protein
MTFPKMGGEIEVKAETERARGVSFRNIEPIMKSRGKISFLWGNGLA